MEQQSKQQTTRPIVQQGTNMPLPTFSEEWKKHGTHLAEYGSEFLGTAFYLVCVIGLVAVFSAPHSFIASSIPSIPLRLLFIGLLSGGAIYLVAISPLGRLSGAHLDPAVSLGFWMIGKMHFRDMLGYIGSQFAGGIVGVLSGHALFGNLAQDVKDAVLHPGLHIGGLEAFLGEILTTFVLVFFVLTFVSHKVLERWTALMIVFLIPILVLLDASISGSGINPARWLGPALFHNFWQLWWVYLFGPFLGSMLAVGLRRTHLIGPVTPRTGKINHDSRYRSLFKHDIIS
jgi:aquaporin Z